MRTSSSLSLCRTFALLTFLIFALVMLVQVIVQWALSRRDLVDWERRVSADAIRVEAYATLGPRDFVEWRSAEVHERFTRIVRLVAIRHEILRVEVYAASMQVIWPDEPRLLGKRFPEHAHLAGALACQVAANLEHAGKSENLYERHFAETVEL